MNGSILIVEDDPDVRQVLARSLSARFRAKTAPDGSSALDLLWREPVDGVVTDLRAPGMDGKELASACARSFAGTPVLVVTASGDLETAKLVARMMRTRKEDGHDDPSELLHACGQALGPARGKRERLQDSETVGLDLCRFCGR